MNDKELIELTEEKILKSEELLEGACQARAQAESIAFRIRNVQYFESLLLILSRSRIRQTAEELPTREDGGTGEHAPYVMAHDSRMNAWEELELEHVADNYEFYDFWTCVPLLPEQPLQEARE